MRNYSLSTSLQHYDVIILGAGAAGLFCAAEAGRRGLRVALLDHGGRPGKKILISGGGRANFTNLNTRPENFLSENPHFAKSALAGYPPAEFVALVEKHGIAYHHKTPGQLFCDGSAAQLVDMLLAECAAAHVEISLNTRVVTAQAVRREGEMFALDSTVSGIRRTWTAAALVIATGGLSIPKMSATGFGYEVARHFGLRVVETRPALVPLTFGPEDTARFDGLSGVATDVTVTALDENSGAGARANKRTGAGRTRVAQSFTDKLLITHRGLSGPAILQISSYLQPGQDIELDLAPGFHVIAPLVAENARRDEQTATAAWHAALPRRLADRLLQLAPPESWQNRSLEQAENALHHWPITPAGTEGYEKAEVTAGGVDTAELSASTMEARRVPGLYFIGEVVDVTGHLGGYNFQWAWASAAAAARALADQSRVKRTATS